MNGKVGRKDDDGYGNPEKGQLQRGTQNNWRSVSRWLRNGEKKSVVTFALGRERERCI